MEVQFGGGIGPGYVEYKSNPNLSEPNNVANFFDKAVGVEGDGGVWNYDPEWAKAIINHPKNKNVIILPENASDRKKAIEQGNFSVVGIRDGAKLFIPPKEAVIRGDNYVTFDPTVHTNRANFLDMVCGKPNDGNLSYDNACAEDLISRNPDVLQIGRDEANRIYQESGDDLLEASREPVKGERIYVPDIKPAMLGKIYKAKEGDNLIDIVLRAYYPTYLKDGERVMQRCVPYGSCEEGAPSGPTFGELMDASGDVTEDMGVPPREIAEYILNHSKNEELRNNVGYSWIGINDRTNDPFDAETEIFLPSKEELEKHNLFAKI